MPSQHQGPVSAGDQLSIIDSLVTRPFPEREEKPGREGRWGGPGYHVAVLRESRDFWEDRSQEVVEAAERELEEDLAEAARTLTGRWGSPDIVDLWPYLGFDRPDRDLAAPQPLLFLSCVASTMQVWRPADSGRWLALAVGQADPEWPFQLLAAVGEASSLPT